MSNAVWRGVPLATLLHAAGPLPGAAKVRAPRRRQLHRYFPPDQSAEPDHDDRFEMNSESLPDKHGFPARVVVPGYFGEKNVKWLTRIELAGADAEGFYEKQGWGPNFIIPTRSRIDRLTTWASLTASRSVIDERRGLRWRSRRPEVEVTRRRAELAEAKIDYPGTKLTWVLWSYDWKPAMLANTSLSVRATDGDGNSSTWKKSAAIFRNDRVPQDHRLPRGLTGGSRAGLTLCCTKRSCGHRSSPAAESSVSWAFSARFPAFVQQPGLWRIGIIATDGPSDARATKRTHAKARRLSSLSLAARRVCGAILARQRISSAIQLPMPGNPFCRRSTALIGARRMSPNEFPHRGLR